MTAINQDIYAFKDGLDRLGCVAGLTNPWDSRRYHYWTVQGPWTSERGRAALMTVWSRCDVDAALATAETLLAASSSG